VSASPLSETHACIVAYLLDPLHGSEPANAWHWIDQMAQRVGRISLITSPHGSERLQALARSGHQLQPNVEVLAVESHRSAMAPPVPGWYRQYGAWLDGAAIAVADVNADLSHHVMVGSPFWGSSLHLARGPRVLGPVGISHVPPVWTAARWGARGAIAEVTRGVLGAAPQAWARGTAGVRGATHVLAADPRTAWMAHAAGRSWSKELLEGVARIEPNPEARDLTLVWAGKLIPRKAPELALLAWHEAQGSIPPEARLVMYGEGPLLEKLRALAGQLGVPDSVLVPGRVPQPAVVSALRSGRGLLFTSLRDTSSSQILEACASGTPSVSLRHPGVNGLDLWYPRNAGWAAEAKSWRGAIRNLSHAIVACLNAPEDEWAMRSARCTDIASRQTWAVKADRMARTYLSLMSPRGARGAVCHSDPPDPVAGRNNVALGMLRDDGIRF